MHKGDYQHFDLIALKTKHKIVKQIISKSSLTFEMVKEKDWNVRIGWQRRYYDCFPLATVNDYGKSKSSSWRQTPCPSRVKSSKIVDKPHGNPIDDSYFSECVFVYPSPGMHDCIWKMSMQQQVANFKDKQWYIPLESIETELRRPICTTMNFLLRSMA